MRRSVRTKACRVLAVLVALAAVLAIAPAQPAAAIPNTWYISTAHARELQALNDHAQVEQWYYTAQQRLPEYAQWYFTPVSGASGYYWIINFQGYCMATKYASTASSAKIIIAPCGTAQNDQWHPVLLKHDYGVDWYNLVNRHSHLCANIQGATDANGADLIQYRCNSYSWNMQFTWASSSTWPGGAL